MLNKQVCKSIFMKFIFIVITLFIAKIGHSQDLKKMLLRVKTHCKCVYQFSRENKPAGQIYQLRGDTLNVAVDKETSGLYLQCGNSKIFFIEFPYFPEKITAIFVTMPCNADDDYSIEKEKI